MSKIVETLDQLSVVRGQLAQVEAQIAKSKLGLEASKLEAQVKDLEAKAKSQAKYIPVDQRHTLVGRDLQLVFSHRENFDKSEALKIFAEFKVPGSRAAKCYSGSDVWSIKSVGKSRK